MKKMPEKNTTVFKAFCDEKRLAILELLRDGEKCACELIEQMKIGQPCLSYHMKILCESGVVDSRPQGKWVHYRLNEAGGKNAAKLLIKFTTLKANSKPGAG